MGETLEKFDPGREPGEGVKNGSLLRKAGGLMNIFHNFPTFHKTIAKIIVTLINDEIIISSSANCTHFIKTV